LIVLDSCDIVHHASEDIQQHIFVRHNILSIVIRRNFAGFIEKIFLN